MRRMVTLAALALMLLGGCVASKVDGNRVNYPNGMAFEISDAYAPVGKVPYQRQITSSIDVSRQAMASSVIHVFVKKDTPFKDKTEFVGAYDFMLPNGWFMMNKGLVSDTVFRLDTEKNSDVAALLAKNGMVASRRFLCGEFYLYTHNSGQQSLSYCAAESVVPEGVSDLTFLKAKFNESVRVLDQKEPRPVALADKVTAPQVTAAADAPQGKPDGQGAGTGGRGKYVVIAYSKVGDTARIGRSYKSAEEALNSAVAGCEYSDCRKIWVSNMDGCVAFAKDTSGAWGKARGADIKEAQAKALKLCNAYTKDDACQVVTSACPEY